MQRSVSVLLTTFVLFLSLAAGGEDNPHLGQNRPAETILSGKGLKLDGDGHFFVLKDHEAQLLPLLSVARERDRLRDDYSTAQANMSRQWTMRIREEKTAEGKLLSTGWEQVPISPQERAADRAEYDRAWGALQAYKSEHGDKLWRYDLLRDKTLSLYSKLSSDPAVKEAIRRYNLEHPTRALLGPVTDSQTYLGRLRRADLKLLGEQGVEFDPKSQQFFLKVESQVGPLPYQVEELLSRVELAENRATAVNTLRHDLMMKIAAATEELATPSPVHNRQAIAKLELLKRQLERLGPDDGGPNAAEQKLTAEVVVLRKAFVFAVSELRNKVDKAAEARRAVDNDRDLRRALQGLRGNMAFAKVAEPTWYGTAVARLAKLERTIRIGRIPISTAPSGEPTISVTLNGKPPVSMAIDSTVRETLLPAALAEELGVISAPGAPKVAVRTGLERVNAKRAPLRSVRIGDLSVTGATCLILPAGATARVVIGTDLLDNFVWDLPAGGAELTLTQVIPALARETKLKAARP
jgi:hypothetical protein